MRIEKVREETMVTGILTIPTWGLTGEGQAGAWIEFSLSE
jgi:hypothetical protein